MGIVETAGPAVRPYLRRPPSFATATEGKGAVDLRRDGNECRVQEEIGWRGRSAGALGRGQTLKGVQDSDNPTFHPSNLWTG